MAEATPGPDGPDDRSPREVLRDLADLAAPWALRAAVGLGVAELIDGGARSVEELASATGARSKGLDAVLRVLAANGVLELRDGSFHLTAVGECLLPSDPESLHADLHPAGIRCHLEESYAGLPGSLEGTGTAYESVHGTSLWERLSTDPDLTDRFDRHIGSWTGHWAPSVAQDDLWTSLSEVVDVGGGLGVLACELAQRHRHLRVAVVERPGTADRARVEISARDLDGRVTVDERDAFVDLPVGADAYVLAQVLHDWDDPEAVALLRKVAIAGGPGTRVVLVERLPARERIYEYMDLLMFSLFGSGERSLPEYERLAAEVGIRLAPPRALPLGLWLIEGSVGTPGDHAVDVTS